jgi:hypothetical protein
MRPVALLMFWGLECNNPNFLSSPGHSARPSCSVRLGRLGQGACQRVGGVGRRVGPRGGKSLGRQGCGGRWGGGSRMGIQASDVADWLCGCRIPLPTAMAVAFMFIYASRHASSSEMMQSTARRSDGWLVAGSGWRKAAKRALSRAPIGLPAPMRAARCFRHASAASLVRKMFLHVRQRRPNSASASRPRSRAGLYQCLYHASAIYVKQ